MRCCIARLVGDAAKNQMTMNPRNTVYDIKRLIGREWSDQVVQEEIINLPFKVTRLQVVLVVLILPPLLIYPYQHFIGQ